MSLISLGGKNPVKPIRGNDELGEQRGSIMLLDDSPTKVPEHL